MTFSLYFYPSKKFWNSNTETHIDSNQMALKSCLFIRFVSCVISLQANSFRFQHNMLTFAAHRTCQIDLFYKFSLARLILLMKVPKINPKRNRFGFDVSGKLHVFSGLFAPSSFSFENVHSDLVWFHFRICLFIFAWWWKRNTRIWK